MPIAPALAILVALGVGADANALAYPGAEVCTISDARAVELSGLVATPSGFVAINDSQVDSADVRIFRLDARCQVTDELPYPTPARDPEDLAIAPDGSLWVADVGDNPGESRRATVALWEVVEGGTPVIHRLSYPDGPHDAEALLFNADGTPVIITKEINGRAGLYRPTGPLRAQTTTGVPMERVGEFAPRISGENNPFGPTGEVVITGAAVSPDRSRIALRTYTAAYEWDIPDGDVVKAITTATPRVTSLPDERQGEAIAYTVDGKEFITVSDVMGPTAILRYTRSMTTLAPVASGTLEPKVAAPSGLAAFPPWASMVVAAGGLLLAVAGFVGLRRSRNRQVSV
jgi:hypothetical protein